MENPRQLAFVALRAVHRGAYADAVSPSCEGIDSAGSRGKTTTSWLIRGIFEEMLREEGMADDEAHPTGKFWSFVGGLSGAAMGFIVANFPGMVAGAVAGNRLGAVRDAKGKSVYAVFQELPQAEKAKLLGNLASKVFANVVSA